MAEYITRIRTAEGDKQIDYNALANLPEGNAPLYITLSYNTDTAKWFSDVNYTADDIVQALNSRQVIAKVMATEQTAIYAPVTEVINTGSNMVVFGVISYSTPTDLSMHWFVRATCDDSGTWDIVLDDQN